MEREYTPLERVSRRFHDTMDELDKARNKSHANRNQAEIDALQAKVARLLIDLAEIDPIGHSIWRWEWVPFQDRCRYFVRREGCELILKRGFRTKAEASRWINSLNCEWRAGFTFRLHWDSVDMHIVDRDGKLAKVGA